jgi:integrase/recombinase XerD
MGDLFKVRMSGPLTPYAAGFAAELGRQGYTRSATQSQLRLLAHVSRWLGAQELDAAALSGPVLERFLLARRTAGYRLLRSPAALTPMLRFLRGIGAAPALIMASSSADVVALERFREYLVGERGLTVAAARGYVDLVAPFVAGRVRGDVLDLQGLVTADVTGFMLVRTGRFSAKTMQRLASALRSLLGFWHLQGDLAVPLVAMVPKVAYRPAGLARGLAPGQVAAMLASCRRDQVGGLRDYAMLLLLSRLGLRCGEVAALGLDDIDWRGGLIMVRGKGNRRDVLPMPVDRARDGTRPARPTRRPCRGHPRRRSVRTRIVRPPSTRLKSAGPAHRRDLLITCEWRRNHQGSPARPSVRRNQR